MSKKKFMEDKKRRLYELIAYEEYFTDLMYNIQKVPNMRWYWVYHDKDLNDDKSPKAPHYHILVYFDNGRTLDQVCKLFKFNKKEKISYWKPFDEEGRLDYRVRYLVHYKSKTELKFEYDIECINSNDFEYEKFFGEFTTKSEGDINLIFDFFDTHNNIISYRTFLNFIYSNGLWGTFRQNALIFNRLFDEHNGEFVENVLNVFK